MPVVRNALRKIPKSNRTRVTGSGGIFQYGDQKQPL